MIGNLSGPTLLVIVFIVLLIFGAPRLPGLAKSLGQSMKILKKEVRTSEIDNPDGEPDATATASDSISKDEVAHSAEAGTKTSLSERETSNG